MSNATSSPSGGLAQATSSKPFQGMWHVLSAISLVILILIIIVVVTPFSCSGRPERIRQQAPSTPHRTPTPPSQQFAGLMTGIPMTSWRPEYNGPSRIVRSGHDFIQVIISARDHDRYVDLSSLQGNRLQITAQGAWSPASDHNNPNYHEFSPDGQVSGALTPGAATPEYSLLSPRNPFMSLLGQFRGGRSFLIGSGVIVDGESDYLYLRPNEEFLSRTDYSVHRELFADNTGSMLVTIRAVPNS